MDLGHFPPDAYVSAVIKIGQIFKKLENPEGRFEKDKAKARFQKPFKAGTAAAALWG